MVKMGAVWDRTMKFIGTNTGAVVTIALISLVVPSVISDSLLLTLVGNDPAAFMSNMGTFYALWLLAFLASLWGQLALAALAIDATLGLGGAFGVASRRFFPALGLTIIAFLVTFLFAIPIAIAMGMSGIDYSQVQGGSVDTSSVSGGAVLFMVLYALALIPLFLWIFARLSVLTGVIVWERRGLGAFARAFSLTRGYALKVIGVVILFAIVFTVASLAIVGVVGIVFALIAGATSSPLNIATVLTTIVGAILNAAFSVIMAIFLTKLYKSLIEEREPVAVFE